MRRNTHRALLSSYLLHSAGALPFFVLLGCGAELARPATWDEATHARDVPPAYDKVFADDVVHRIDIEIHPSDFDAMEDDLSELVGPGFGGGPLPFGGGANNPCSDAELDDVCEVDLFGRTTAGTCQSFGTPDLSCLPRFPGGGPSFGDDLDLVDGEPIYVPVQVTFEGGVWTHVGMRYKGNSSLSSSVRNRKKPFRLNFDRFEERFPEIHNQRFLGFDKLTFSSNWLDDSQLRELYVTELLREHGVPAARTAFYRVFVDVGEGPQYWGLYTAVEDPSDPAMLDSQLGGRGGNLYKPDGPGADWVSFHTEGFVKKTNSKEQDYSDVERAVTALHAETGDPGAWRAALDAAFDTDGFLTWLAINTAIQNWDSYGTLAHNYYLYAPPAEQARLTWIPWDHNLSMAPAFGFFADTGEQAAFAEANDVSVEYVDVFHADKGSNWPLITKLLDDEVYRNLYRQRLGEVLAGSFALERASTRLQQLHELVAPFVVGTTGEQPGSTTIYSEAAFQESLEGERGLLPHIRERHRVVRAALDAP